MSARYVRSFQNKHLLEIFPFLNNNCRKKGNMRTGTEIVNPCINVKCFSESKITIIRQNNAVYRRTFHQCKKLLYIPSGFVLEIKWACFPCQWSSFIYWASNSCRLRNIAARCARYLLLITRLGSLRWTSRAQPPGVSSSDSIALFSRYLNDAFRLLFSMHFRHTCGD